MRPDPAGYVADHVVPFTVSVGLAAATTGYALVRAGYARQPQERLAWSALAALTAGEALGLALLRVRRRQRWGGEPGWTA
jgi:hypothetical protein